MNSQKNNNNNNVTLSIGTESQYSETSPDIQSGGHFLSFLTGSNEGTYATSLALDAFNKKIPQTAYFVITNALKNSYSLDFSKTDQDGRNLIHLIVESFEYCPERTLIKQILLDIFKNGNMGKYLNAQDNKLNTPCHYAMALATKYDVLDSDMQDIIKLFAQSGADLTIKNANGFSVALKSIPVRSEPIVNVQLPINLQQNDSDIFVKMTNQNCSERSDEENVGTRLDKIIKMFTNKKENDRDTADTINFNGNQISDTSISKTVPVSRVPVLTQSSENSDLNSIDVLNMIMNDFRKGKMQQGGSKTMIGKRNIVTYSEVSIGGNSESTKDDSSEDSDDVRSISSMARAVENKATEAHKRAVERIKELLNVDETEARAYKALIYDAIKKDSPQLSNYDKAMELEKRASDKNALKAFSKTDIKNMVKIIAERQKEREVSSSTSEVKLEKKKGSKKQPISEGSSSDSGLETISTIEIK
jgi:hypothetical protein